ncbi:MAG: hypothetical protein EA408_02505 [Marinilabiliales bacterium]|nr:MAG: hypothetical protein EA408_02505 [Marinilabiliales bacterium]
MRVLKNMLIAGGTGRNAGKTEYLCRIIGRLSGDKEIITLKISGIKPGNDTCHGRHGPPPEKFRLIEETCRDGVKDSSKMLLAGAARAFYLRTRDEFLEEALDHFLKAVGQHAFILAESARLRKIVRPGLFIMVRREGDEDTMKSVADLIHLADVTVSSDGASFDPQPERIILDEKGWHLDGD